MHLTVESIYAVLNVLSIEYEGEPNDGGWLKIRCPSGSHPDENPSAGINLENGHINCFACGYGKNLVSLFAQRKKLSGYSEALTEINKISPLEVSLRDTHEHKHEKSSHRKIDRIYFSGVLNEFNPKDFSYTLSRGYTEKICKQFDIRVSNSSSYYDYMIIPIRDYQKGIVTFEARKLKQYEYLKDFYNVSNISFKVLSEAFKKYSSFYGLKLTREYTVISKNNNSLIKDEDINTKTIRYLLSKKVLYPPNTTVKETLYNISNTSYNSEVYVCEGIGSFPKLYTALGNNVVCTFGSKVSKEQLAYLDKFHNVVIIPDNDSAGFEMVKFLHENLTKKLYVIDIPYEDTDEEYTPAILNSTPLISNKYILNKFF